MSTSCSLTNDSGSERAILASSGGLSTSPKNRRRFRVPRLSHAAQAGVREAALVVPAPEDVHRPPAADKFTDRPICQAGVSLRAPEENTALPMVSSLRATRVVADAGEETEGLPVPLVASEPRTARGIIGKA